MRCAFHHLRLRPRLKKHNLRAVDGVRLDVDEVDVLLDVGNAHHVAVGSAAYLDGGVSQVRDRQAFRTQWPLLAVEAEVVLLILPRRVVAAM